MTIRRGKVAPGTVGTNAGAQNSTDAMGICPSDRLVSMVDDATATLTRDVKAGSVIEGIRTGGKQKDRIKAIRETYAQVLLATGDREEAKKAIGEIKKNLPAVCWSGRFSYRANKALVTHSGLLCADLDALGDDLPRVREILKTSPYLWALFLSPSGDGLKAVFRVPADGASHLASYRAVERHVMELTGVKVDGACKDLARLCFASFDPKLFVNDEAIELPPMMEEERTKSASHTSNGSTPPMGEDVEARLRIVQEIAGAVQVIEGKYFVRCPGQHLHTQGNGPKDCEVYLDRVPTLHCVHTSCAGIVAGVNHELRSRIGKAEKPASSVSVREPRPIELQPVEPYMPPPLDLLPAVLREYIEAAAESLNVDISFILLPKLPALASAIGNSRSIMVKRGFIQPPILWTGPIGRSGGRKSPSLDAATFATREREKKLIASNRKREQEFSETYAQWENANKKERGPRPEQPMRETVLLDDLTLAALADAMQNNPRGLLVCKDELSQWFTSFDQFTDKKGCELPRWLTLHSGYFFGLDRRDDGRRGRSYRIFNPRVCISGSIQPAVLSRCLTPDYFERGLPARFIFAMPPFRQDRWTEATIPEDLIQAVRDLFASLYALEPERDGEEFRPALVRLNGDAKEVYIEFYNRCGAMAAEENERGEAAWAKATGTAARLALVGMLVNDPVAVTVTGGIMLAATALAQWCGNEATRIYQTLGETPEQSEARRLVEFIQRRGGAVTVRDLTHGSRAYRNQTEAAEAALNRLAAGRLGKWDTLPPSKKGGPSSRHFRLAIPDTQGVTVTETPENTRELRGYGDGDRETFEKSEAAPEAEDAINDALLAAANAEYEEELI